MGGPDGTRRRGWFTGAEWLLLLILGAVQFTHIMDFMIVLPLGPTYMREMSLSPQQFDFMVSAYAFSAAASGLLAAWFLDRFDRKRILLFLYAGFTVGTVLCAIAPGYLLLVLARAVAGAFGGIAGANVLAIVGDAFAEERRGRAMGVVMSAFSLASIAGVPAGLWLAEYLGWRMPFVLLGAACAAILVLAARVLPPLRGHLAHGRPPAASTWAVLRHPAHVRAYALMCVLVLSTSTISPNLAIYLVYNVRRLNSEVPWVYVCGGVASLVALNVIGKLADQFGKLRVFRALALFAVLPALLITNLPPVSLATVLVVSTVFMVATSGRFVPATALVTSCVVPRYRGSFLSLNASVQQLGFGLAAVLAGSLLGLETRAGGVPAMSAGTVGLLASPSGGGPLLAVSALVPTRLIGFGTVGIVAGVLMLVSVILAGTLRPADEGPEAAVAVDAVGPAEPAPEETPRMIRPVTPADVSALCRLIRGLAEYERLTEHLSLDEDRLHQHLFGPRPFVEALLAEEAGEAIGYALFFHNYSTFRCEPTLFLEDLFVVPERRGQGHGKALLAAVARLAVERGCARLEWSVLDWNEPAIRFYRSLGAEAMDAWTIYRLSGTSLDTLAGRAAGT